MSEVITAGSPADSQPPRTIARAIEDSGVLAALLLIATVPIVEIVLRKFFRTGISGAPAIVQHLTLVVSMLGASLAARESRLLSLATTKFLSGRVRVAAALFSGSVAASVTAWLAVASFQFVIAERDSRTLAYAIPLWVVQLVMPVGFAVIALRLLWHASERWSGRTIATTAAVALCLTVWVSPFSPQQLALPALIALFAAAILGAPIFVILGGAALILFWDTAVPIAAVAVGHYSLVVNPSLPAIPLFTLTGYLLAEGGASKRLVDVFDRLFGGVRGGPAIVTALACAFFTTFTGGSGVTILALGGLLFPILRRAGYSERSSLGLLSGAGSLGVLFPPCLPLILYAIVAHVRMEQMFLGGIVPGVLMLVLTAWWGMRQDRRVASTEKFSPAAAAQAVWEAKWELLLPVVVIVVLFGGFATPVETAAFTAIYALIVEGVIHRELKTFAMLSHVFSEAGLLIGGVLLILGVALGFTNFLVDAEIPAQAVAWATASIHSKYVFLLLLNLFLLAVGGLMDIFPAIVVVVPLVVPLGAAFGIDPTHLGIVFLANLELGYLMPPVGINLLIASYRFEKPMTEIYRAAIPMLLVLLVGVLLITYIPPLTTFLPRAFAP
jgi:tripartite ATP-independent transporter DctM subunit